LSQVCESNNGHCTLYLLSYIGNNTNGELGTGVHKNLNVYKHVGTDLKIDRLCMTSPTGSTLAYTTNNEIVGCGYNMYGELALHKELNRLQKIPFKTEDNIVEIAHGSAITAIVTSPVQISKA
jgi:alpha-tubulin suppressor-like RCC1 family protein